MIFSKLVRQISKYTPVGEELEEALSQIQSLGCKVLAVWETEVNKAPDQTTQGFIILYSDNLSENEKTHLAEEPTIALLSKAMKR